MGLGFYLEEQVLEEGVVSYERGMSHIPLYPKSSLPACRHLVLLRGGWKDGTGVPCSLKTVPPWDRTVGICLGPYGGPKGGFCFL